MCAADNSKRDSSGVPLWYRSFWWEPVVYLIAAVVVGVFGGMFAFDEHGFAFREWMRDGWVQVCLLLSILFYVSDLRYRLIFKNTRN